MMMRETDLLRRAAEMLRGFVNTYEQVSEDEPGGYCSDEDAEMDGVALSLLALADQMERAERDVEPAYTARWNHGCNALCTEIDLWVNRCPHCGKPAPQAAMQEPKP